MIYNPFKDLNALDWNRYEKVFAALLYIHPKLHPLSSNRFSKLTVEEQSKIKYAVGSKSEKPQDIWDDASYYIVMYFKNILNESYY